MTEDQFAEESGPNGERSAWIAAGFGGYEAPVNMYVTAICTPVAAPAG